MNKKLFLGAICASANSMLLGKRPQARPAVELIESARVGTPLSLQDLIPITNSKKLGAGTSSLGIISSVRREIGSFVEAQLFDLLKVRLGFNASVASTLEVFLGDVIGKVAKMVSFLSPQTLYGPIQMEVLRFISESMLTEEAQKEVQDRVNSESLTQQLESLSLSLPAIKLVTMPLTILKDTLVGIEGYRNDFLVSFPEMEVTTEEIAEHLMALLDISPDTTLLDLIEELTDSDVILRSTFLLQKALSIPMEAASIFSDALFGIARNGLSVTEAVLHLALSPLVELEDLATLALLPIEYAKLEGNLTLSADLKKWLAMMPRFELKSGGSIEVSRTLKWEQQGAGSLVFVGPLLQLVADVKGTPGKLYSSVLLSYPGAIQGLNKGDLSNLITEILKAGTSLVVDELPGDLATFSEVTASLANFIDARLQLAEIIGVDLSGNLVAESLVRWGCHGKAISGMPVNISDEFCNSSYDDYHVHDGRPHHPEGDNPGTGHMHGGKPGHMHGGKPGHIHGGKPGHTQGGKPGHMQGGKPGHMQGGKPGHMQGGKPGHMQGGKPGHMHGDRPGHMHGDRPGHMHGDRPGNTQGEKTRPVKLE